MQKKVVGEFEKVGDERLEHDNGRLLEHLQEEESKHKRKNQAKAVEIVRRVYRQSGRRRQKEKSQEAGEEFR